MNQLVDVSGVYAQGGNYVSTKWPQICADHREEFPQILQCKPGTFNVSMQGAPYLPPNEIHYRSQARMRGKPVNRYQDGNHISPCARVVEINGTRLTAWLYRGGHTERPVMELISEVSIATLLKLRHGMEVRLKIEEVPEGTLGMPAPPPSTPGETV